MEIITKQKHIGGGKIRQPYLDYARVFVAFLVVYGHLLPKDDLLIRPFVYAFHMPFFFLVSGILHKYTGEIQVRKYFLTIIVPFIFFNALFFVLKPFCYWSGMWNTPYELGTGIIPFMMTYVYDCAKNILLGINGIDGPTWFLIALFWCKLFTDILSKKTWFWLCFGMLFIVFPVAQNNVLFIRQACQAFPFFIIGFACKKQIGKITNLKFKWLYAIVLMCVSVLLTKINGPVSNYATIWGKYPIWLSIWIFYINALIGSLSILCLSALFRENYYVQKCAMALLTILCAQSLFNYVFYAHGDRTMYFNEIWLASLIMIACVFIHFFLEKYIPQAIGKCKK